MTTFFVRVELIDLPAGDNRSLYGQLHDAMEAEDLTRKVLWPTGLKWLPDATYFIKGAHDIDDVLERAKRAIATVKQKARILVVEGTGRASASNLKLVEDDEGNS